MKINKMRIMILRRKRRKKRKKRKRQILKSLQDLMMKINNTINNIIYAVRHTFL